jgi:tripartite-type tricarboxylate transporter receptor subunit TctC
LGSQIDIGFLPVNGATSDLIAQGRLQAFGVTAAEPYALLPHLPPLATPGSPLSGFNFDVWGGMHIPRAVPYDIAERWNTLFYEITAEPEFRAWARGTGSLLLPRMSLAELQSFYERETQQYQALAKSVGVASLAPAPYR